MRLTQISLNLTKMMTVMGFFVPDGYIFEDEVNSTEKSCLMGFFILEYIKILCYYFSVSCCNAQVLFGVIEGSSPCFSVSCCNVLVLLGVIEVSFPCIIAGIYLKCRVIIEVYKLKAII